MNKLKSTDNFAYAVLTNNDTGERTPMAARSFTISIAGGGTITLENDTVTIKRPAGCSLSIVTEG